MLHGRPPPPPPASDPSSCGRYERRAMVKNKRDLKSPRRRSGLAPGAKRRGPACAGSTSNIRVIVRVRPMNKRENGTNSRMIVKVTGDQVLTFDPEEDEQPFFYHGVQQKTRDLLKKPKKNMEFVFDRVFGFEAENQDVFEASTEQLIDKLMEGCNCSVFVYGATGAGKTYTMLGRRESPGITVLTIQNLFGKIDSLSDTIDFQLAVTYLEVYNENVQDLLNPGKQLHLREDGKYGIMVAGIKMEIIKSAEQLFTLLEHGNKNRTQHPTDSNSESSRSHAVFQVYLRMTSKLTKQVHMAKLSMIDLAGSERGAATGCVGARFKEGSNINKSLLALGNCINSLADGKGHVPYRDSKLTRLLKDSLGGNCHTVMVANISPSSLTYEDTYNTLKYATRAMKIKSCIRKNIVNKSVSVEQYEIMISNLKAEVERWKQEAENRVPSDVPSTVTSTVTSSSSSVGDEDRARLRELAEGQRKLLHRLHQLQYTEQALEQRRRVKEEHDNRLSDLFFSTPDKSRAHLKLGATVVRMSKQQSTLKDEIYRTRLDVERGFEAMEELAEGRLGMRGLVDVEKAKLRQFEAEHKVELEVKRRERSDSDSRYHREFTRRMANLLRSCYLQLKGQNQVSESTETTYRALVHNWRGGQTVTFSRDNDEASDNDADPCDNPAVSASSEAPSDVEDPEDVAASADSLSDLVSRSTELLRDFYLELKGRDQVSAPMEAAYRSVMRTCRSLDRTARAVPTTDDSRKRKMEAAEPSSSASSLDSTFSLGPRPPGPAAVPAPPNCAKQLLAKVKDMPPPPKVAKLSPTKDRKKTTTPKPSAAMGTSQRFPSALNSRKPKPQCKRLVRHK